MFQHLSVLLGIIAGVAQLYGYWWYNTRSVQKINTGSWSIWALGGVIDLVSYFAITHDWVVNLLPAACAIAAVGTFIYALVTKRFSRLARVDYLFLSIDGGITIAWIANVTNAVAANVLYQVSTVGSFMPMLLGLLNRKDEERPTPWFIWTGAYVALSLSVALRHGQWVDLAYPVSHALTHLAVALVAVRMRSLHATA